MQQVIVQKFGGTSVGSGERIAAVAEIIKNEAEMNTVVVCCISNGRRDR